MNLYLQRCYVHVVLAHFRFGVGNVLYLIKLFSVIVGDVFTEIIKQIKKLENGEGDTGH